MILMHAGARSRKRPGPVTSVHLTETCDDDSPHLVTNVETTQAPVADHMMTSIIHTHLAEQDLLPSEHIVDTGYVTSDHLVTSQEQKVDFASADA
jgi:transposase